MRRLLMSMTALGLLAAALTGCSRYRGICDCHEDDPCCNRAPWYIPGPQGEVVKEAPAPEPKKL
jgi:hypothetical protein